MTLRAGGSSRWLSAFLGVALAAGVAPAGAAERNEKAVVVVNGPQEPVPVAVVERAFEPFQRQFALDWADAQDFVTASYTVPADRRLVIEYASLSAYLPPSGLSMFVRIVTTLNGSDAFHTLAVQKGEDWGVLKQFGAAHTVKIYADPGSTVRVSTGRVPAVGTASATVTLSGHLEALP